jgi:hypothetical protein
VAWASVLSPELFSHENYRNYYRKAGHDSFKTSIRSRFKANHGGSSKPVRCGNPTLGRFDSGAAPLSRFWRVCADYDRCWIAFRPGVIFRSRPLKTAGER